MAKLKYDEKIVNNVLDYLDKAKAKLSGTETDLSGAVNIVSNARGAQYVGSIGSLATVTGKPAVCIGLIENAAKEITTRENAIVQYNNNYAQAPLWKKLFGTIGMAASKVGEGFVGAFEDIGDAVLLVGAWAMKPIDALFNTKASEAIINFQKRDLSRELFDWVYYDRDIAQYSAFGPDSLAASVFRGLGQATGYILMGGYLGGSNNFLARVSKEGSNLAKVSTALQSTTKANALVAAVGGLGSGSEDAFDHGFGLGAATLFGIKDAAIQGGMAYIAGKIGESQQAKAAQKIYEREMANAEQTAKDRIASALRGGKEWNNYLKYTDGAGNIIDLDGAIAQVQRGATAHYNQVLGEISKLGGFTDRLTSKAYEKGFYDMQNLYTVYEQSGKGAAGLFKAATVGQLTNLKNTAKDIAGAPGRVRSDMAAYSDYRAALREANAAQAAGKNVPASVQARIDKYLNNTRGLDMFRVSNVNPTNNIAKGGVLGADASHAYKLAHTRATVGEIVGSVAQGTAAYAGMNMIKDSVGELGQTISQSLGMDTKLSRALFVDENRKYYDEDDERPDLMPEEVDPVPPTEGPPVDPVPPTDDPGPGPGPGPGPDPDPDPDPDPQPRKVEPEPAPQTEPKTEIRTEPKTEPQTEPKTEIKTEPYTEPKTEPYTEPKTEPKPEPVPQTAPEYVPEYEVIPNTRVGGRQSGNYGKAAAFGALAGAGVLGASLAAKTRQKDEEEDDEEDEENIEEYTEVLNEN